MINNPLFGQAFFIVWRESIEAMLVIGILYSWIKSNPQAFNAQKYLWFGVGAGLVAAVILGTIIMGFSSVLEGNAQEYFHLIIVSIAAILIVQMVFWMRQHGRYLKSELHQELNIKLQDQSWWGIFFLSAIAIAREGSETVIFLYGVGQGLKDFFSIQYFTGGALIGFILAGFTFYLLQLGYQYFSWRTFFRITEIILLFLAAALFMTAIDKMISLEWIPITDNLWDTSFILDDHMLGGLLPALTGYKAQPTLIEGLLYAGYWIIIIYFLYRTRQAKIK
ncbi:MAG: FTR1 family protein [Alphaproteobacteria bacterium]|nr:FTR1 family protein [Alphaproteobacteria bacterium]